MEAGNRKRGRSSASVPNPGAGSPAEPGEEPGEDYLETEIELAELVEMMLEDIGLTEPAAERNPGVGGLEGLEVRLDRNARDLAAAGQKTQHQGGDKKNGSPGAGPDDEHRNE